jgi:glycosyltransferase involved in cell wall biosynthesis
MVLEHRPAMPLVTVITATFNAAATVGACLASVQAQDYARVEHLVIDGASSDTTMEIVREQGGLGVRSISEPDRGIYDAWNKGLELARGQWVAFLGADDCYEAGAISAYMRLAAKYPTALYLSGKVRWIGPKGRNRLIGAAWQWPRFQRYMCTAHVGSMHSRRLFEKYGRYDASLRIVADYELLLRAGSDLPAAYLPEVTATMLGGGASDSLAAVDEAARVKLSTGHRSSALVALERVAARQTFRAKRLFSQR